MGKTFIEKCICGEALAAEADNYIADWHKSNNKQSLSKYLGMTDDEYIQYVKSELNLVNIIENRKKKTKIF